MTPDRAQIREFLANPNNFKVAAEVHRRLPEVRADFLKRFADRLSIRIRDAVKEHGDWRCVHGVTGLDRPKWQGISLFRDRNAWSVRSETVKIRLEAQGRGPQDWIIGVSGGKGMIRDTVATPLADALGRGKTTSGWPWYQFVDKPWKSWYDIAPALARETEVDGDATKYYLGRFRDVCEKAIPIIDDAVRRARETTGA